LIFRSKPPKAIHTSRNIMRGPVTGVSEASFKKIKIPNAAATILPFFQDD
jgi:hypothetical protein